MNRIPLAKCTACRTSVLDSFTSLVTGVSLASPAAATRRQRPSLTRAPHSIQSTSYRSFSGLSARRQISTQPQPQPQSEEREPSVSYQQSASETSSQQSPSPSSASEHTSSSPPSIPWYLQVEEPAPPAPLSPLLALQEIPPLPSDPPAILSSVLEHLSVQIGLDNLVLLDLRHLDPPPALGANLIMVIGTARSVKHLNVSADRFCRWVRKEYKLRPYADGLLGRNELKLKLRRKARKLKLAQTVGNTMAMKDADDGITTGWICVNMGLVDDAVLPDADEDVEAEAGIEAAANDRLVEEEERERERAELEEEEEEEEYQNPSDTEYVGFGSRPNSPRIVVQMFTEEKRVEMDLEGLWAERNTRRQRREEKASKEADFSS